jgi:hypothetical protein
VALDVDLEEGDLAAGRVGVREGTWIVGVELPSPGLSTRLVVSTPPRSSKRKVPSRSERATAKSSKSRSLSARFSRARRTAAGLGSKR